VFSHLIATLSMSFPVGEEETNGQIAANGQFTDPVLRQQIQGSTGQKRGTKSAWNTG